MSPPLTQPYSNVITTIHLIGPNALQKSEFALKKLSQFPIFHVLDYFSQITSTLPKETFNNSPLLEEYWQTTASAVYHVLESTIRSGHLIAVVESPGNLPIINQLLEYYRPYRIWIESDSKSFLESNELSSKDYFLNIYASLSDLWQKHQISVENIYYTDQDRFDRPFPPKLARIIHLGPVALEPDLYLYRTQTKTFICRNCLAEFSKPEYLRLHLQRVPSCQIDLI
jgi:hypothetical protein